MITLSGLYYAIFKVEKGIGEIVEKRCSGEIGRCQSVSPQTSKIIQSFSSNCSVF